MKEEIVKRAGEDGVTIECISARLLKARISIESNFGTFVVAYAPTRGRGIVPVKLRRWPTLGG